MSYLQGFNKGAKNFVNAEGNFTRTGIDGAEELFSLFGTDKFFGEVLDGRWVKGNDTIILGPHTSLITGGALELTGRAAVGANFDYGWIWSKNRFYMLDESIFEVHLKLPGHTAANELQLILYLTQDNAAAAPYVDDDWLRLELYTDNTTYKIRVRKSVGNAESDDLALTAITNAEGTFRVKFQPDDTQYHIYFHDGAGAIDEDTDEITGSPFTSTLNFNKAYVAYQLSSSETTNRTVTSEHVTITYPDFYCKYDLEEADVNLGDCKIWDQRGEASETNWIQVFDEDHDFEGDIVIQNGLTRLWIDETAQYGLELYSYISAAWTSLLDYLYLILNDDSKDLSYPFLKKIQSYSPDKIIITVRLEDSPTQDSDYYIDIKITLERGKYNIIMEIDEVYPQQVFRPTFTNSTLTRWGYVGDAETHGIGDSDLDLDNENTTMTDNFLISFDHTGAALLGVLAVNEEPNTRFDADGGGWLDIRDIATADISAVKILCGLIPFPLIVNLFKEAEDAVGGDTSGTVVDPCAGSSPAAAPECVLLNANTEYVQYSLNDVLTLLPEGRYVALIRALDSNQVASDFGMQVLNSTETRYLNQENTNVITTLTASYAFYQMIFDLTSEDSGDNVRIRVYKATVGANDIHVDYFLIVPICDGESLPQDLAHGLLRGRKVYKRLFKR